MADNKEEKKESNIQTEEVNIKDMFSKVEDFVNKHNQIITIITSALVIIVGGYYAYINLYLAPISKEAASQIFKAEQYFGMDSFDLALNGDGNNYGFIDIIDEYGGTKSAELANYYAGICYLNKLEYENAIEYLSDFSTTDEMLQALAWAGIGDANMELDDKEEAINYYEKAAYHIDNEFLSPILLQKVGLANEENNNNEAALKAYKTIKEKYAESNEGREIEKYIARIEASNNN